VSGSFDGAAFAERGQSGATFPIWSAPGIAITKKIPGGANSTIQVIGIGAQRLGLVVKVTAAQLAALYAKRGVTGSLVFGWETCTAYLESIENVEEQLAGKDVYFATLNLIRQGSGGAGPVSTSLITETNDPIQDESGGDIVVE
jgi:hypothetical protein